MSLIMLKNPFIHHYAGSVFDLDENYSRSEAESDARINDRISPQRNYLLPDSGRGHSVDLPLHYVTDVPPSLIAGLDLTTGPCRITSVKTQSNQDQIALEWQISKEQIGLLDTDAYQKQIVKIQLHDSSPKPRWVVISDRKQDLVVRNTSVNSYLLTIDMKEFNYGFYAIQIDCKKGVSHRITLIKCFPLVVTPNPSTGYFTTIKTIW